MTRLKITKRSLITVKALIRKLKLLKFYKHQMMRRTISRKVRHQKHCFSRNKPHKVKLIWFKLKRREISLLIFQNLCQVYIFIVNLRKSKKWVTTNIKFSKNSFNQMSQKNFLYQVLLSPVLEMNLSNKVSKMNLSFQV